MGAPYTKGEVTYRYVGKPAPAGLTLMAPVHKLIRTAHHGWWADDLQDETYVPALWCVDPINLLGIAVPTGQNWVVPGYYSTNDPDAAVVALDAVHIPEESADDHQGQLRYACNYADSVAEHDAEESREYYASSSAGAEAHEDWLDMRAAQSAVAQAVLAIQAVASTAAAGVATQPLEDHRDAQQAEVERLQLKIEQSYEDAPNKIAWLEGLASEEAAAEFGWTK